MSVTESKTKTERKSNHKPSREQETALSALLAQTTEVSVPLASLIKSPLNMRTVPYSAESVSELTESIKGVGLLQNLVVHTLPDDRYGVAAGDRRLAALNMLAERGIIPANWSVHVKVIPQELVMAASMVKNGHHRDTHPAEQIAGFRAMAQEGKIPAQIGDLLGYSSRYVQRMLKLADPAPVILDALAEDRITTEHCQALALKNDTTRQVQVFETACQSGWGGKPDVRVIRNLITENEVAVAGNSKFRFVRADAFSSDELRTDLFSDGGDGYVDRVALDVALLEKLQVVAEHLREAEGQEWCAGRMESVGECRENAGTYRCLPELDAVLTEAEEERLNELMTRYDALENQYEESDLLEAEMKLMRCMAKVRAWMPEMRTGSGVMVSWRYGNVCVQRGVQLRSEDDTTDDANRTERAQEKASVEEISLPLLTKVSSERTLAVQATLMQQLDKPLALLAWTLCLNVFGSGAYGKPAQISLECKHYSLTSDAPSEKEGAAFMAMMVGKARLAVLLPERWSRDMTTLLSLSQKVPLSLLSFCTVCSIHGVQTHECGHISRSPLDMLEGAIGFHMRDWWQSTKVNFFGHLKKPQIIATLNDARLSGAARDAEKMKKGDAAEHAEHHMKDNRWVSGWMCTPHLQTDITERTDNLADTARWTTAPPRRGRGSSKGDTMVKAELTLNVLQTMSAQEHEDIRAAGSNERRELTHAMMRELDAPDNWAMNGEYGSELGGFFPVQIRFTPAHERFRLALCSLGDVSQVWVLVLVSAGDEPFAVVQVQRRFASEAVGHSLVLAASLDAQGYSINDITHILMAEGGQI